MKRVVVLFVSLLFELIDFLVLFSGMGMDMDVGDGEGVVGEGGGVGGEGDYEVLMV